QGPFKFVTAKIARKSNQAPGSLKCESEPGTVGFCVGHGGANPQRRAVGYPRDATGVMSQAQQHKSVRPVELATANPDSLGASGRGSVCPCRLREQDCCGQDQEGTFPRHAETLPTPNL